MDTICLPYNLPVARPAEEVKDTSITLPSMEEGKPALTSGDARSLDNGYAVGGKDARASTPASMKEIKSRAQYPRTRADEDSAFADVPNEILIQIFEYILDDEQIYALALVSRRLHHVALPVYLSRKACGVRPNDQLITSNYNARDAFRAIRVALFRPALARLHFTIDCHKTDRELSSEIEVLVGALTKLSTLHEMVLSFQNTSSAPVSTEEYGFPGGLTSASLAVLLDAVLAVGCHSITVRHCGSQNAALPYIGSSLEQANGGMWNLAERLIQKLIESILSPPLPLVKNSNLTVFHLHSPMALHPHLYRWTIDTLNHSAIDTLSVSQQQCTGQRTWELVLPRLYFPALTDLSLDFASVDIPTLFAFLARHPHIRKLHFGRNFMKPMAVDPLPSSKILAEVTHIIAPSHWLCFLLYTPESLPSLVSATALIHVPVGGKVTVADLDASLKSSMFRLAALREVSLSLSVGAASSGWIPAKLHVASSAVCSARPCRALHGLVMHMNVSVKLYVLPPAMAARLPAWLAQFPALWRFELLMLSEREPAGSHERAVLSEAIMRTCPGIDSVKFGLIKDSQCF